MTPELLNQREKIIHEIARRQGKCMVKRMDKVCNEEKCKTCEMQKHLDELKADLPEYYKFRIDDEAESFVEHELEQRKHKNKRPKRYRYGEGPITGFQIFFNSLFDILIFLLAFSPFIIFFAIVVISLVHLHQ